MTRSFLRKTAGVAAALALGWLATAPLASAQSATINGMLTNFDVVNNIGMEAHGFEVEVDGVQPADLYGTFTYQRYGVPDVTPTATGILLRWTSAYDASAGIWAETTVAHLPNTPFAGTCYMGGIAYADSGCEHFGVHLAKNPTRTVYRWLAADPTTPGTLFAVDPPVAIPSPVYAIVPPAQPVNPPQLVAEIVPPEPAEQPQLYGNAQWVKIFKTELTRPVELGELLSDNAIVPQDPAQVEVAWDILQTEPPTGGKQKRHQTQGGLNHGTRAVIRRYELYQYTGAYDPISHQVVCGGDGTCSAPLDGELGDYIGAQMAAANVEPNGITVTKIGTGSVASSDKVIACGSACAATYTAGALVTLTASPASGTTFMGWTGACAGTDAKCNVTVTGDLSVGATFAVTNTLSIGRSGKGSVLSVQPGINCGSTCSAKFAQGSVVTLVASPVAGGQFTGWTGDCTGTASSCTVTIARDTKVQANFK